MPFKKTIVLLLIFLPSLVFAQGKQGKPLIDSLTKELQSAKEDTNKVKVLNSLSRRYYEFDLDTALVFGQQALTLAEGLGYKFGTAKAYNILGGIYYLQGNTPEALKSNAASMKLYTEIGNKEGIANCYLTIGNCYGNQDNYPDALKNYFAALKIYEEIGVKKSIIACYNNIGAMYHSLKNDSEAMKNYSAGIRIVEKTGNKLDLAMFNDNIGSVYYDKDSFKEALQHYNIALKIYQEIGQKNGLAHCYTNIGAVHKELGNYGEALKNYFVAAKLLEEIGNKYDLCIAYGDIGFVFDKQKKYSDAEIYFNKELALGKEISAFLMIKDANSYLSALYEHTGDFKRSLESYKAFIAAKDSVFNKDNAAKILRGQMQFDFDKKEALAQAAQSKKDALLQLKLQRKNILIYGTLSAFVALLVIGILLIRQNKLKANQQKTELEQKQLRAQMNPHFIFNCLNSIQHFVVANDVKNANRYLSGFALLMRQTLENSKEGIITLRKEIEYLENYLVLERMRFEDKFTYEILCADNVNKDTIEIPSMIIQPFIENAIRHGLCYLEGQPGTLKISFYTKDKYVYCEVDDNGIGRERSQKLKVTSDLSYESRGMELTRQRLALVSKSTGSEYKVEILDKKNDLQEPAGTTIVIKFPLNT